MSNPIVITSVEQLAQFRDERGIVEIAVRSAKKRFKAFQKVMIERLPEAQEKEITQRVIETLNQHTKMNKRNLKLLSNMAKVQELGLLLNGLNLCATVVGFAIMYAKLAERI